MISFPDTRIGRALPYLTSSTSWTLKAVSMEIGTRNPSLLFFSFSWISHALLDILISRFGIRSKNVAVNLGIHRGILRNCKHKCWTKRCKIGWELSILCRPCTGISANWVYINHKFILVKVLISLLSLATSKQIRAMRYTRIRGIACAVITKCLLAIRLLAYRIVWISAGVSFQGLVHSSLRLHSFLNSLLCLP